MKPHFNHIRDYCNNTFVIGELSKITTVNSLAERLKYARELRGLSQGELAKKSKCSQGAIGNVESGERDTLRNLIMVARALDTSADWLYDGKGPKPQKGDEAYRPQTAQVRPDGHAAISIGVAEQPWPPWPFSVSVDQVMALTQPQRDIINAYIEGVVHTHEAGAKKKSNGA